MTEPEDDYDDDATTTQARSAAEGEPHEVTAMYDNLGGLLLGLTYGTPVLDCSCGYSTPTVETWAEAGEHYDQHLVDEGVRPDA